MRVHVDNVAAYLSKDPSPGPFSYVSASAAVQDNLRSRSLAHLRLTSIRTPRTPLISNPFFAGGPGGLWHWSAGFLWELHLAEEHLDMIRALLLD